MCATEIMPHFRKFGRWRTKHAVATAVAFLLAPLVSVNAAADEALIAVAANFSDVVSELDPLFEAETGHVLVVTLGSTGKLYAQIRNGAPFHALLAADQRRPELLEAEGRAIPGSRFTYAVGRLTLWSADADMIATDGRAVLRSDAVNHIAIANPDLAPYGAAARQALQAFGLWQALSGKIVMGENIGQTFAMTATGNAELGFVALSSVLGPGNTMKGSRWDVPADAHDPIRQDAVLLQAGKDNAAAAAFVDFLKSPRARAVIERYGYGVE